MPAFAWMSNSIGSESISRDPTRRMMDAMDAMERLRELFVEKGSRVTYGGSSQGTGMQDLIQNVSSFSVNQLEHALQTARQAREAYPNDPEVIIAALLHDIGWLVPKPNDSSLLTSGDHDRESNKVWLAKHDIVGSNLLRRLGFSDRTAYLVEGHVQAKRYLCFKDRSYYHGLSEGSKFTLHHQGGVMTAKEANDFEKAKDFELCCALRKWDEGAKIAGLQVPSWDSYEPLISKELQRNLWQPRVMIHNSPLCPENIVTDALREQLKVKGYVVLENWLSIAEMSKLETIAQVVASLRSDDPEKGPFHTFEYANGKVVPSRSEGFADCSLPLEATQALGADGFDMILGNSSRLGRLCTLLRGDGEFVLYKEKINYKMVGGGGYKGHQDYYGKMERDPGTGKTSRTRLLKENEICVCMIAIDDMDEENGCPEIAPCFHLEDGVYTTPEGLQFKSERLREQLKSSWKPIPLQKGAVLIYGNRLPHRSTENKSNRTRRALFSIYSDARLGNQREVYYEHESQNRRKAGSHNINGKANVFFTGQAYYHQQKETSSSRL